jgi:site-specific recombinase XerC
MDNAKAGSRDLASMVVPQVGRLVATEDPWEPYRLLDPAGAPVKAVSDWFQDLQAAGRSSATLRSYGMDLLRWFRFLWAVGVPWDRATRIQARDFCRWLLVAGKPARLHWRKQGQTITRVRAAAGPAASTGQAYAASVRAHSETVLRSFYDFHRDAGSGPILNPFPLDRSRRGGRAHAHHNPMDDWDHQRVGRYRPTVPQRIPRAIPDEHFNELLAALPSNRDRALVAFWISTGVRASELLGVRQRDIDAGQQLITVIRKGARAIQQVPASADAFVWLRLYQEELHGKIPRGRTQPVWWTLRQPYRPLTYHAAHRMFERANAALGADWTLHDLRHSAAARMVRDPQLTLTDVQWVLGHAQLTTTQTYLTPSKDEVVAGVLAHHARQARRRDEPPSPPAPGYDPQSLSVLFGRSV